MVHEVLTALPRNDRRRALAEEARSRRSGDWGDWETFSVPRGSAGRGWAAEFTTVHRNKVFAVLERDVGTARHFAVSSLSGERPTWHEMQRIKDDLAGLDVTAVEIYPPRSQVMDGADMFHIWALPAPLPFTLR